MSLPANAELPAFVSACAAAVGPDGILAEPARIEPYVTDFWRQYQGVSRLVLRPASVREVAAWGRARIGAASEAREGAENPGEDRASGSSVAPRS